MVEKIELIEDTQRRLDELALDLQREIKKRFDTGWKTEGGSYIAIGLGQSLQYLNYHFRTDYETDVNEIVTNDLKPIRKLKIK